jgi:acyl-CoA thioester hydrolase
MGDFFIEKKVYYHDTDAGGVVYYANYLKHLEEGRTEYLRSKGIDVVEYARNGIIFPVVRLEIDYKTPARYGDTIRVLTRPEKIGNASLCFSQEIKRGEATILRAKTVWACVKPNGSGMKTTRIPEEVRSKIGIIDA